MPFKENNSIFITSSNTLGNFKKSDREIIYSLISKSMSEEALFFDSVYYVPEDIREKWDTGLKYRVFEGDMLLVEAGFLLPTQVEGLVADYSDL